VPEAVRRAARRADELMAQQNAASEAPSETPEPPEPLPTPRPDQRPEPRPEPHPQPPPEPRPEPPTPEEQAARGFNEWEQRYRTLQGKYDSEIAGLRSQVTSLERLLSTLQAPAPQPQPRIAPPPLEFSQEDKDLYGEDLLQAMARTAEARSRPYIDALEAKLARLEGGQNNLAGQQLQDRVFDALDQDPELAGRWRPLNTSREFSLWLSQIDEMSGLSRNDMLQHAYANGDAIRTGRFFKRYMAEHTVPPPPQSTHTAAAPAYQPPRNGSGNGHAATTGMAQLEDFASPGRAAGRSQGSNGAPQTRIWSRPEITAFYRDRTTGRYRGREEESNRLEADIIAAAREGRIQ
jgi:hypothetical protein